MKTKTTKKTNGNYMPELDTVAKPVLKPYKPVLDESAMFDDSFYDAPSEISREVSREIGQSNFSAQVVQHNIQTLKGLDLNFLYKIYGQDRVRSCGKKLQAEILNKVHKGKLGTEQLFNILAGYLTNNRKEHMPMPAQVAYSSPLVAQNMKAIKAIDCSLLFNEFEKEKVMSHDLALQNYIVQEKYKQRLNEKQAFDMLSKSLRMGLKINGVEADIVQYGGIPTFVVGREGIIGLIRKALKKEISISVYYESQLRTIKRLPTKDEIVEYKTEEDFLDTINDPCRMQSPSVIQISMVDSDIYENFTASQLDRKTEIAQKRSTSSSSPWKNHRLEMLKKTALKAFAKTHTACRGLYEDFRLIYNDYEDGLIPTDED